MSLLEQVVDFQFNSGGRLSHSRLEEALALYREVGDQWGVARSLYRFGTCLADLGGDVTGQAMLEESSAILEELGDKFLLVSVLVSRGIIALSSGEYAHARSHLDRSLAIAPEIGDLVPCKNSHREKLGKILISFAVSEFRSSGKRHNIQPMRQESGQRFAT